MARELCAEGHSGFLRKSLAKKRMEHVARKFSRAKWEVLSFMDDNDIAADAITSCLKTVNNTLSFWNCTEEQSTVEEVVLALATGPKSRLEKLHLLALSNEDLQVAGLSLRQSDGQTVVQDLRNRHVDMIELTLVKLSRVAHLMASQIRGEVKYHLFTKRKVREIVRKAISSKRVSIDNLPDQIKEDL